MLSSQVHQTKPFGVIINEGRKKLPLERGTTENLWWKSNFKQICFQLNLQKVAIVSKDLIVIGM